MVLGETVSIDGGLLLLILAVFLLVVAALTAIVVLGFVWAARAGRGSTRARVGFSLVVAVELLAFVAASGDPRNVFFAGALVAVLGQAATYVRARSRR